MPEAVVGGTRLAGKVVVITGAGRGLGAMFAGAVAAEGASVVVNDLDVEAAEATAGQLRAAGADVLVHACDVSDWDEAHRLVAAGVEHFGAVDGLVNNAGIVDLAMPGELARSQFERVVAVNLVGVAACGNAALAHMLARGSGSIVNVTSGAHLGSRYFAAYSASKGGVASLTYSWASEVTGTSVRVNAISPNADSRMRQTVHDFYVRHGMPAPVSTAPPDPSNNGAVVALLLSDKNAMNGQLVRIDGTELSLLAHPVIISPVIERPAWTVEDLEAALNELADSQVPLGLKVRAEVRYSAGDGAARPLGVSG